MIVISPCLLFIVFFKWIYWQFYIIPYSNKQPSGHGIPKGLQNYGIYSFYFLLILRIAGFYMKPKEMPINNILH